MAEQLKPEDISLLEKFRAKAAEFLDAYYVLMAQQADIANIPELEEEFDSLYADGAEIKDTIDWITSTVDAVTGWFSGLFGSTQMGVLPLIPIAAIGAAIAYMVSWVGRVYLFERKVSEVKRLAPSMGIDAALQTVGQQQDSSGGLLDTVKEIAKPIGFAVGAFVIWKIFDSFNTRSN